MSAPRSHRLSAVLVAFAALVGVALPTAGAAPAALPDPGAAALDWIEDELATDEGLLTISFDDGGGGVITVPDYGLTLDAVLALAADDRGDEEAASTATELVEASLGSYISGADFGFPDERYAGAIAKATLAAIVQGEDPTAFGGFDLEDELRSLVQTGGPDAGRVSDAPDRDNEFGADFSNGFGQALAVLALARTDGGVPASVVSFLLAQQCPGGGFRGDYTTSGGCTADSSATVDATGFALMALSSLAPTCATRQAAADAVASLAGGQNGEGAFGGETGSNANSTGIAAVALRSVGAVAPADEAAAFIAGLQLEAGEDVGAVALNAAGFASAADGIQVLERDGFRRASTQGTLAFGLRSYAQISGATVAPEAATPCATPPADEPSGNLSTGSIVAGGTFTATGAGFDPGETVRATLFSTPIVLGTARADADGAVSLALTIPADVEPGRHTVELRGLASGVTVELPLEVLGQETPRALPATGGTTAATTGVGGALVALGAALVALARRRSTRLATAV